MTPTWQSLTALVADLHPFAQRVQGADPRLRAAEVALRAFGPAVPAEMVNIAALADAMRDRLVAHRISVGAARLVHETDLHTLPGEPPTLLRGSWLLETRDPAKEPLFAGHGEIGHIAALGGYPLDDQIFFVGLGYPDGIFVGSWRPQWGEKDLKTGLPDPEASPLIADISTQEHAELVRDAARFALVLGIHLDAEGTPVAVRERTGKKRRRRGAGRSAPEWSERRVYLDRLVQRGDRPDPAGTGEDGTDGRILSPVMVRGHLRRQAYGPRLSLRKWVYIESHEARRWISPRPLRIDVRR